MRPEELQELHRLLGLYRDEMLASGGDNDAHYLAASSVYWEVEEQLAEAEQQQH